MILGLSLILAFLTYLIYRRLLLSTDSSGGSSRNSSQSYQVFPMWPFLSTLLQQQSSTTSTTTTSTSTTVGPSTTAKRPFPTCQPTNTTINSATTTTTTTTSTTTTTTTSRANDHYARSPVVPAQYAASPDTTPKATPIVPAIAIDAIPPVTLEFTPPSITINVNTEDEDDAYIPSFPSLNSAQRASSSSASLMTTTHNTKPASPMAPPPIPIRGRNPKANVRYATPTTATPSAASVARQNPNGAARSRLTAMGVGASGVAAGSGLSLPGRGGQSNNSNRKKVVLEPGHSPLDWARLQRSGIDLRGLPHSNLIKVPPSLLAKHAKAPEDIWTALNGRVYNITAYLPFHPGGEKDLLRGAGKDSTKLFNATHPWVNVDGMLAECLIGIFVSEEEAAAEKESPLDTVD